MSRCADKVREKGSKKDKLKIKDKDKFNISTSASIKLVKNSNKDHVRRPVLIDSLAALVLSNQNVDYALY